ncbi:hypothetical protein 3 [Wenzhou tombus-like virus 14]|uniref:hypothetical protein 3 n=1 Tax=Wenzhou tombus-like virus 14 TaxID=1923667 RepID=UPI000909D0DC|nr:hypothetical protein 3 [Wenzhou tombus-like virus 14]APG76638.1 hypothetical protein 3 [Wenzhou tombus-like virus 14]
MPKKQSLKNATPTKPPKKTATPVPKKKAPTKVVMAPTSISIRTNRKNNPAISRSSNGKITITHREYVADIASTTSSFSVTSYPINPGLNRSFPWLSSVASAFESYRFQRLTYEYQPLCPTSTAGKLLLTIDYDAADVPPTNKVQASAYQSAAGCSVWDKIQHHSNASNLHKLGPTKFTRTASVPTNADVKTYDAGNLYVCTSNTAASTTSLGELWVSYTVTLTTPQITNVVGDLVQTNPIPNAPSTFGKMKFQAGVANVVWEYGSMLMMAMINIRNTSTTRVITFGLNPKISNKAIANIFSTIGGSSLCYNSANLLGLAPYKLANSGQEMLWDNNAYNTSNQESFWIIPSAPGPVQPYTSKYPPQFMYNIPVAGLPEGGEVLFAVNTTDIGPSFQLSPTTEGVQTTITPIDPIIIEWDKFTSDSKQLVLQTFDTVTGTSTISHITKADADLIFSDYSLVDEVDRMSIMSKDSSVGINNCKYNLRNRTQ